MRKLVLGSLWFANRFLREDRSDDFHDACLIIVVICEAPHYGNLTGTSSCYSVLHQFARVDQQSGADSFLEPLADQIPNLFTE